MRRSTTAGLLIFCTSLATPDRCFAEAWSAQDWEILGVSDLGEEIWSTPALDGGRVLIRTQRALHCFGKKAL